MSTVLVLFLCCWLTLHHSAEQYEEILTFCENKKGWHAARRAVLLRVLDDLGAVTLDDFAELEAEEVDWAGAGAKNMDKKRILEWSSEAAA